MLALFEELIERGALETALSGRSEQEFSDLVGFIKWKVTDHRYQSLLVEVARILVDMYSAALVASGDSKAIRDLWSTVQGEVEVSKNLK